MILLFLGAGALGQLFAAKISIHHPEIPIYLFVSPKYREAIRYNGLTIQSLDNREEITKNVKLGSEFDIFLFDETKEDLHVFVTSKAYSNENIATNYRDYIGKARSLVILQNGIGNEEFFLSNFPMLSLYRMTTSNGALIIKEGLVRHTGKGMTYMGAINNPKDSDLQQIYEVLNSSEIPIIISKNIDKFIWEKLLVNVCINAIGALTHNRNGTLLKSEELIDLMRIVFDEALKVAYAECKELDLDSNLFPRILDIMKKTETNKNSMFVDLENNRQTEIDFMNGKISEWGKKHAIPTPINDTITTLIRNFNIDKI